MDRNNDKLNLLTRVLDEIKKEHDSFNYHEDDTRKSYLALYSTVIRDFHFGRFSFLLSKMIANNEIRFKESTLIYKNHIIEFRNRSETAHRSKGYLMLLNRNVLTNSWTVFETCVTLIYDHVVSENKKKENLLEKNRKLIKLIEGAFETGILSLFEHISNNEGNEKVSNISSIQKIVEISKNKKMQLIQEIIRNDFTPINRKFRTIIEKTKYKRNYKNDIKFIDFVSTLRNCMLHSNGLYRGNQGYHFTYKDVDFKFENDKMFEVRNDYDFVYFDITMELKSIFMAIVENIDYDDTIPYIRDYNIE